MAEAIRSMLRQLLLDGYEELKTRLTRRFGSIDLACEALQDTFLRLEYANISPVINPKAYLMRAAISAGINRQVAERRHTPAAGERILLEIADDRPDPCRAAEARSEIAALKRALAELPERRREIFMAAWIDETPHQAIADRFGLSLRMIQIELKHAVEHCAERLDRPSKKKFAAAPPQLS